MIRIHWIMHNLMKYMDKCASLSHTADLCVRIRWNWKGVSLCAIFPRNLDEAHYTLWKDRIVYSLFFVWFIILLCLILSGSMEPVEANKFVIFWSWWRIETDANFSVNNVPENFSSVGFGVNISQLKFLYFVYQVKCFVELILVYCGD